MRMTSKPSSNNDRGYYLDFRFTVKTRFQCCAAIIPAFATPGHPSLELHCSRSFTATAFERGRSPHDTWKSDLPIFNESHLHRCFLPVLTATISDSHGNTAIVGTRPKCPAKSTNLSPQLQPSRARKKEISETMAAEASSDRIPWKG